MTSLMSNVYWLNKEEDRLEHLVTGLIGVFDSRERAIKVWNDKLIELGIPEDRLYEYAPTKELEHRIILLNDDGKAETEHVDNARIVFQLMIKDSELNEVLTNEFSKKE